MKDLLWILLLLPACVNGQDIRVQETAYRSVAEAREAGAIEQGWLPEDVPRTTELIREAHDTDTAVGWIAVEYDATEYRGLTRRYQELGWQAIPYDASRLSVRFPDPPVDWWPVELRPELGATPHTDVLTRSTEDSHRWWLFVMPTERQLFIWHGPESIAGPLRR